MAEDKKTTPTTKKTATTAKKSDTKVAAEKKETKAAPKAEKKTTAKPAKTKKTTTGKTVTVRQIGSPIGRPADQRGTLIGLGLNKMNRTKTLEDTPAVRGMIRKIPHLVEIVEEVA